MVIERERVIKNGEDEERNVGLRDIFSPISLREQFV
jgi:hypothetical protein